MSTITIAVLDNEQRVAQRVVDNFSQAKGQLYRQDGAPIYSPQVMKEKLDALLIPLNGVFGDIEALIAEASSESARLEQIASGSDPLNALTGDELAKAASLQTLLADEVTKMALTQLAERLTAVSMSDDKASRVVLHRLASQRLEQARELMSTGAGALGGPGRSVITEQHAFGKIAGLLETIGKSIADPAAVKAASDAAALRKRAFDLRKWSWETRSQADGSAERARVGQLAWAQSQF